MFSLFVCVCAEKEKDREATVTNGDSWWLKMKDT